jgi:hypothetical protein
MFGNKKLREISPEELAEIAIRNRVQAALHSYLTKKHSVIFRRKAAEDRDYVVAYIRPEAVSTVTAFLRKAGKDGKIKSKSVVVTEFFECKEDAVPLLRDNPHSVITWRDAPKLQLMY